MLLLLIFYCVNFLLGCLLTFDVLVRKIALFLFYFFGVIFLLQLSIWTAVLYVFIHVQEYFLYILLILRLTIIHGDWCLDRFLCFYYLGIFCRRIYIGIILLVVCRMTLSHVTVIWILFHHSMVSLWHSFIFSLNIFHYSFI